MKQMKCNILIVEDSHDYCEVLKEFINLQHDMKVVGIAHDGDSALELLSQTCPDVVLLDIIMPKSDGFTVLNYLKNFEADKNPIVIVVSALSQDNITQSAMSLGAEYYFIKPVNLNNLTERVRDLMQNKFKKYPDINKNFSIKSKQDKKEYVEEIITKILINIGIYANLNGYHYIRKAVQLLTEDFSLNLSVTKDIYPYIAKQHKTTPEMVERAIRSAIEKAWKCDYDNFVRNIYGLTQLSRKARPTNSEFLAVVADKIRLIVKSKEFNLYKENQ